MNQHDRHRIKKLERKDMKDEDFKRRQAEYQRRYEENHKESLRILESLTYILRELQARSGE